MPIKHLRAFPIEKEGQPTKFGRFKFPLLRVIVQKAGAKGQYEITWSNYHGQKGSNPGKFKLKYVSRSPKMIYVKDGNRVRIVNRNRQIDVIAMAVAYGTELIGGNLVFADNHPLEKVIHSESEHETLMGLIEAMNAKRFTLKVQQEIVGLFVSHSLMQAFLNPSALRKAA